MSRTTHTCPSCDRDDRVQAVPAVYLAGRDTVSGQERNRDGDLRTVTRAVTTGLSDALAPVPPAPTYAIGCLGLLAAAISVGTFLGGVVAGKWFREDEAVEQPPPELTWGPLPDPAAGPATEYAFLGWISTFALLAALTVLAVVLRRRTAFARLTRGRHRAEELWAHGWYCHRCGTVHLEDVPGEDRTPLSLQRFRERVWEHGGYGDLAAARRALNGARR